MRSSHATPPTPSTPGPTPLMRARTDDQEPQPTPKKLKSELTDKPTRRPALRDVTNELRVSGSQDSVEAKKLAPLRNTASRIIKQHVEIVNETTSDQSTSVCVDQEESTAAVQDDVVAAPCATEEEDLASEHLVGREEEDELVGIMYEYLREKQTRNRVSVNYFEDGTQPHINAKMRSILVDWLIEIHYRLKLCNETLFLAINYLDRYLAEAVTTRSELQLVGITSLFIASKFEEVEPVDLDDLSYVTDKTYTGDEIIAMERKIIDVLQFNLAAATSHSFADYFSHRLGADKNATLLAAFLSQSMLLHLPILACYPPAERAAAAVFLAQCATTNERPSVEWITSWEATVTCSFEDLLPCLQDLSTIMAHPSKKLASLRTKFGTKRFGRVANKPMDNLERFL